MTAGTLFDEPYYIAINEARWAVAKVIIGALNGIDTCVDVGSGPGWFSSRLVDMGFDVFGFDGRSELVEEAARRVPSARFAQLDVTSPEALNHISPADLVFCFGLLYHLENPFAAVRNLRRLTSKWLLIETQVAPGDMNNLILVSEGQNETQGLNYHALIPSRRALLKMLYVAGFKSVYRFTGSVSHEDFTDLPNRSHRREIFLATADEYFVKNDFILEPTPRTPKIDYAR